MFLLLFLLWVVFNGKITLEICLFGVAISALICLFCFKFMSYRIQWEWKLFQVLPKVLLYGARLVAEMFKSSWYVAKLILSPVRKPRPILYEFSPRFLIRRSETVLANSITLTPGTITARLEHGELCVHCLDKELADDLEESLFVKQIRKMEATEK